MSIEVGVSFEVNSNLWDFSVGIEKLEPPASSADVIYNRDK